jgi:putative inorganic carbon (hco3(-)) transporter
MRVVGRVLSLPMLLGVFLSNSRGGMLACGAVAAMYTWRRWGAVRAGILCGALVLGALTFGPSRVREQNESDEISTQGRIEAWHRGIELLKQHPLLGCGTNEFTKYHYLTAHNSFVLCFAENGMAGFVAWMGLGFYALYGLNEARKRSPPGSVNYRQTAALTDSLIAFYVGGFFLSRTYFIILPVILGLAISRYKLTRDELQEAAEVEELPLQTAPVEEDDESLSEPAVNSTPMPNLNWASLIRLSPWLIGISIGMIFLVEFVVRVKR